MLSSAERQLVVQRGLVHKRQNPGIPRQSPSPCRRGDVAVGKELVIVVVIVEGQAHLLQIVLALGAAGRFPRLLDCGQEQSDQDRDDRNDHQQLNQRKSTTTHKIPPNEREEGSEQQCY